MHRNLAAMKRWITGLFMVFLGIISLPLCGQLYKVQSEEEINSMFNHPTVKLKEGVYCLPVGFTLTISSDDYSIEGVPGKTTITSYDPSNPSSNFRVRLLDTNQPDLFEDGVYVVADNPTYSFGGGFKHLVLPYNTAGKSVLYTQGTVLVKKDGLWSRHFTGSGFHVRGSLKVKNINFENCQFYLFSPFGKIESENFSIINCRFNNVARVLSSSLFGGKAGENWFNSLTEYPSDGNYRFKEMLICGNSFSQIHTCIIWGCPPVKNVRIINNTVRDCPTAIAFFDLCLKNFSEEDYFANRNREYIANNSFEDIVQGVNRWTITLTRTAGKAIIKNNRYINCNTQLVLLYGGNSVFKNNRIVSRQYSSKRPVPLIMVKNIGHPHHLITKNIISAPEAFLVALEGKADIEITKNNLDVGTVYSKNNPITDEKQSVIIENNRISAETLVRITAHDSTKFGLVKVRKNNIKRLVNFRTGKAHINSIQVEQNRVPQELENTFPVQRKSTE